MGLMLEFCLDSQTMRRSTAKHCQGRFQPNTAYLLDRNAPCRNSMCVRDVPLTHAYGALNRCFGMRSGGGTQPYRSDRMPRKKQLGDSSLGARAPMCVRVCVCVWRK